MGSFFDNWISNGNTDKYPPHSSSVWKAMYSLCEVEKGIYQTDTIKHWFKTQEFPVQRYLLTFMTYSKITITPFKIGSINLLKQYAYSNKQACNCFKELPFKM
jgi:hypothetical protein